MKSDPDQTTPQTPPQTDARPAAEDDSFGPLAWLVNASGQVGHVYRKKDGGKLVNVGELGEDDFDVETFPATFRGRFGPGDYEIRIFRRGQGGKGGMSRKAFWTVEGSAHQGSSSTSAMPAGGELRALLDRMDRKDEMFQAALLDITKTLAMRPQQPDMGVSMGDLLKIALQRTQTTPASELITMAKLSRELRDLGGGDGGGDGGSMIQAIVAGLASKLLAAPTPSAPQPQRRRVPNAGAAPLPPPRPAPRPTPPAPTMPAVVVPEENWKDKVRRAVSDESWPVSEAAKELVEIGGIVIRALVTTTNPGSLAEMVLMDAPDLDVHMERIVQLEMSVRSLVKPLAESPDGPDDDDDTDDDLESGADGLRAQDEFAPEPLNAAP